jgi:uncharacterized membrane protein YfcA
MTPNIFVLVIIGLVSGVFSGLFGIGGGIVLVPLLIFVLNFSLATAGATSLVALLAPVGALGAWHYYKQGVITQEHIRFGLLLSVGIFFGGFFGAKLGTLLNPKVAQKIFAVFLFFGSIRLWFSA